MLTHFLRSFSYKNALFLNYWFILSPELNKISYIDGISHYLISVFMKKSKILFYFHWERQNFKFYRFIYIFLLESVQKRRSKNKKSYSSTVIIHIFILKCFSLILNFFFYCYSKSFIVVVLFFPISNLAHLRIVLFSFCVCS